jgi:hypothetical protein
MSHHRRAFLSCCVTPRGVAAAAVLAGAVLAGAGPARADAVISMSIVTVNLQFALASDDQSMQFNGAPYAIVPIEIGNAAVFPSQTDTIISDVGEGTVLPDITVNFGPGTFAANIEQWFGTAEAFSPGGFAFMAETYEPFFKLTNYDTAPVDIAVTTTVDYSLSVAVDGSGYGESAFSADVRNGTGPCSLLTPNCGYNDPLFVNGGTTSTEVPLAADMQVGPGLKERNPGAAGGPVTGTLTIHLGPAIQGPTSLLPYVAEIVVDPFVQNIAEVPEPAAWPMLGAGLAVLAGVTRPRTKRMPARRARDLSHEN